MPRPVTLVTGYVPIQGHPRTAKEYGELGENLFRGLAGDFTVMPFYETVAETWLAKFVKKMPYDVSHSAGDNPAKNSLAYHCVNHQKFGWLLKAAILDPIPETFVWMDYGIGHLPGVTADVVNEFIARIKKNDCAIPGCWPHDTMIINDYFPCWRFCGSLMVVPRARVHGLFKAVKYTVEQHVRATRNVTWEVNSLAMTEKRLVRKDKPLIRWYEADHNKSMFTNYEAPHDDVAV